MARADRIPDDPWQEIVVAISGPAVNFALAIIFYALIVVLGRPFDVSTDFLSNLLVMNVVLGLFNLIPAFPMDGGRILRGLLATKLPYLKATRYAKNVGQIIALAFVVIGFKYNSFIMLPVIAVFIFIGAINEENVIRVRYLLNGKQLKDLVPPNQRMLNVEDTVESVQRHVSSDTPPALPVTDEARAFFGAIFTADITRAWRAGEGERPMRDFLRRGFPVMTSDTSAPQAYYFLKAEKKKFAGVVDDERYVGLVYFDQFLKEPK